ncbi:hypothetical protein, partial [Pseudomonas putida]|uniref:hypothetical protein n=1 Tax=Pseudomonas putida TaxID=303 RepID=UPI001C2CFEF7
VFWGGGGRPAMGCKAAPFRLLLPAEQQSPATICLFFLQLPLYPPRLKLNRFTETILSPYPLKGLPFDALAVFSTIKR